MNPTTASSNKLSKLKKDDSFVKRVKKTRANSEYLKFNDMKN